MISSGAHEYCCEDISNIENYDEAVADTKRIWHCHHRREIQDGITIWTPAELKKVGQYYNRPANELIFLTSSEHNRIHNLSMSDTTRKKLATSLTNRNNSRVYTTLSEETRKKISAAQKGKKRTEETRRKISEARKRIKIGKWYNNGLVCVRRASCPEGFVEGRLHGKKI